MVLPKAHCERVSDDRCNGLASKDIQTQFSDSVITSE